MGLNQQSFFSVKNRILLLTTLKHEIISILIRIFSQLSLPLGKECGKSELCHLLHGKKTLLNLSEACSGSGGKFLMCSMAVKTPMHCRRD